MSNNALGDPRSGRDRRVPTRKHAFERGTLDPITTNKRPLFTIGNGILLVAIIGYGMYATGNLPQLDAFFDNADKYGKQHNSTVVNGLLTYGTYLFFGVIAILVGLILFSFVNAHNRHVTDRRADEAEDRRRADRRSQPRELREDMPSLVMPLGKERPTRRQTDNKPTPVPVAATPAAVMPRAEEKPIAAAPTPAPMAPAPTPAATPVASPAVAATPAATPVPSLFATSDKSAAKAEAIAAAAQAQEAADNGPTDPSSFVPMPGKERLKLATDIPATPAVAIEADKPAAVLDAAPVASQITVADAKPSSDTSALNPTSSNILAEAAIAQAKAIALKAEAAIAVANAQAAIAQAKAEVAIAEAAAAAAKAASLTNK